MSKRNDGFLIWPREPAPERPVPTRLKDAGEFVEPMPPAQLSRQAGRCMGCGIPFCHQGCPLGNPIPDFNAAVARGRFAEAFFALDSTNNFPEFTGRLCPAPCEAACTLNINDDAVTIEQIEKEIVERAFAEGWVQPRPPARRTGKTVAVVGSGPAGLAAAVQLNRAGHTVTVYEKADRLGGLLRYGIPDFKLEKWVIDRRIDLMTAEGVRFRTGVNVGQDPSWGALKAQHDAVVLAIGAARPRTLAGLPGADLPGVHLAMDFLAAQNDAVELGGAPAISAEGKRVIILGGGDTGSDCLGTSLRQGAKDVRQIELFPAPPQARDTQNPWPQWPLVLRTSSSHREGGARDFALMTEKLSGKGKLQRLHARQVEIAGGRPTPIEGSEQILEVDLLLLAMGFVGPDVSGLTDALGLALTDRGAIAVGPDFQSTVPGVFAAGDAQRGASLIVWAISEGREAARGVDAWLMGKASPLPTRGVDRAFGGR
ncbi:MAG: glutamate synthase subunit beta [Myxococcales bacterium]|nr:glutamate synthase subunit beta [Myxococcales bacterium]MCB9523695.1 glutamate synthase subunit beta [Myxococcales bacterium]